MLNQILKYIRNYFEISSVESEEITTTGVIVPDGTEFKQGQYVLIKQSILNDGVYQITAIAGNELKITGLSAEAGNFQIYGLAIPKELIEIALEIEAEGSSEGVASESLGDYSVSYTDGNSSWKTRYKTRLNDYRRLYREL